jgi:tRNA dimethylallyltransferase
MMVQTLPILILGPTAGGKSDLALALAQRLDGEIVSADSMQVYRRLDAGTAKPSPHERRIVPHHLIDIVEPTEPFTAAQWLQMAHQAITRITAAGRWPIIVGGTNLYIQALLHGMFDGPPADTVLRASLAQFSGADLHQRLQRVDPAAARRIHVNDLRRLVRALEVYELTGRPISDWQCQWEAGERASDMLLLGLDWPVPLINRRINLRVKAMFYPQTARQQDGVQWWVDRGLVEETRELAQSNLLGPQASQALGYKQVLEHLRGQWSEADAFEKTKILTRRFAKQQRTWLRRFRQVHWLEPSPGAPAQVLEAALEKVSAARKAIDQG